MQKQKNILKCPECNSEVREIEVRVDNKRSVSHQCKVCKYFTFDAAVNSSVTSIAALPVLVTTVV